MNALALEYELLNKVYIHCEQIGRDSSQFKDVVKMLGLKHIT